MWCSKCRDAEAEEGQRWCPACQAAYMREYRRTTSTRAVRAARRDGAQKFKERAIREFQRLTDREMNGLTAAAILEDLTV
jgi:hypothetical protein